jgi:hypothetical protein
LLDLNIYRHYLRGMDNKEENEYHKLYDMDTKESVFGICVWHPESMSEKEVARKLARSIRKNNEDLVVTAMTDTDEEGIETCIYHELSDSEVKWSWRD